MRKVRTDHRGGRGLAYVGTLFGLAASMAVNVAHTLVSGEHSRFAIGLAFVWPCALLLATELLGRVAWPAGRVWLLVRLAGIVPVAVAAATISYGHTYGLMSHYGEPVLACLVAPLGIDGLMVISSAALLVPLPKAQGRPPAVAQSADATARAAADPVAHLLAPARTALAGIRAQGKQPSRAALGAALRAAGHPVSKHRVSLLWDSLIEPEALS